MNPPTPTPTVNEIIAYLKRYSPVQAYSVVKVGETHFLCLFDGFGFGIATELVDDWYIQIDQQFS